MSTYELTREAAFRGALREGRLLNWEPSRAAEKSSRIIAGPENVVGRLDRPWGDGNDALEIRRQKVLAACSAFVEGKTPVRILFKSLSRKKRVAEMRVLAPKPGVRLVGCFLDDAVFVVFGIYFREEIDWRGNRSPGPSALLKWKDIKDKAEEDWAALFPYLTPVTPAGL